MSRTIRFVGILLAFYAAGYFCFRQTHIDIWQRDRQAYVIFPEGLGSLLYYGWRPLSYIDGTLTGMRFHIGPHG